MRAATWRLLALAPVTMLLAIGSPLLAAAEGGAAGEAASAEAHEEGGHDNPWDWKAWHAGNNVRDKASLQRGATAFVNYCLGCHSIKYLRYERMAKDLDIPLDTMRANMIPTGDKPTDYMMSTFPAADAEEWFGRLPPDLSLTARAKGADYAYRLLKTFYVDPSRPNGTNNLALPGAAMPAVLSDLEGVKAAHFTAGHEGIQEFERFEQLSPGHLTPQQYDAFVRDIVNFLDYAGEPAQVQRRDIGIWVVLFLLVFTWFGWLLKREYWKDVR